MNQNQRRHRGTILILVVAVLGLLVILGTAFLASSRSDSNAARQMNTAVNLDLATKSVLSEVQNTLLEATLGPPDGSLFTGVWTAGRTYTLNTDYVISPIDGRVYRCSATHVSGNGNPPPPGTNWALYTTPAALLATRNFDYPERGAVIGLSDAAANPGMRDQSWLAKDTMGTDVSVLNGNCFNPSTGTFNIPSSVAGQTPVISPGGANDGAWYLLPFSTQNGIRYRYSVRILDTNRMANLNVGQAGTTLNYNPRVLTSLLLNASSIFDSGDDPKCLNVVASAGIRGRGEELTTARSVSTDQIFATTGDMTTNFPLFWQSRVLSFERFGWSTTNMAYPQAEWFDLSDELELRAYGTAGNNYMARPATNHGNKIWPNTLGAGRSTRQHYTTYSFDRTFSPVTSSTSVPYSITIGGTAYRWPGNGANSFWSRRLNAASLPATASDNDVAIAAVYLLNSLYAAGFSEEESLSYVVNWVGQTGVTSGNDRRGSSITNAELRMAPLGHGVATRTYVIAGSPNAASARRYYAYSAQPYINQVAVQRLDADSDSTTNNIVDFAVELINPYAGDDINLVNWRLRVHYGGADYICTLTASHIVPKITGTADSGLLVLRTGSSFVLTGANATISFTPTLPLDMTGDVDVYLERPYTDTADKNVIVDYMKMSITSGAAPTGAVAAVNDMETRANVASASGTPYAPSGGFDPWLATTSKNDAYTTSTTAPTELGKWNTLAVVAANAKYTGVCLRDRMQVTPQPTTAYLWDNYLLLGDMSAYSRFCNRIDAAGVPEMPLSYLLNDANTPHLLETSTIFPEESKMLMDFTADPRAATLVSLMTSYDRTADGQDEIGEGVNDSLDEVRTAGRVNLNTASVQVIYALLRGTATLNQMSNRECAQRAAYIVAYRDRTTPPKFTYDTSAADYDPATNDPLLSLSTPRLVPDFGNTGRFPGKGIHSLAELAIPLGIADLAIGYNNDGSALYATVQPSIGITPSAKYGLLNASSLGGANDSSTGAPRGAMWQRLLASATVRSDTFVVYGYVEAVKQNRSYSAFDNANDWYFGATAPRNPTAADRLQRVSARRFIAIVDRSWCNAGRGSATVLPKIVAYKELPR